MLFILKSECIVSKAWIEFLWVSQSSLGGLFSFSDQYNFEDCLLKMSLRSELCGDWLLKG